MRPRHQRCWLIAIFAVTFLAVTTTPATAADGSAKKATTPLKAIWGPLTLPSGASAFPVYSDLGVDVLQHQLIWSDVARRRPARPTDPADPAYAWTPALDAALAEARRLGIQIALMVRGAPHWANGGHSPEWAPDPVHYARFLTAASRRYPTVRRWMIWGEPNRSAAFRPLPPNHRRGPRVYARMLDAAYGALKRRSRRNVVIGGMTFSFGDVQPAHWVREMRLPNGRRPRLDEYGHNPFTYAKPNLNLGLYRDYPDARDISQLDTFTDDLRRAYRDQPRFRKVPPRLWLSEFTVSSDRPNRAFSLSVSRAEQASWLRSAFTVARRVHASGFGWFNLIDEPPSVERGLTTGLLTSGGRQKPAYRAYKRLP